MIQLDRVTLFNINCHNSNDSVKALNYSSRDIKFGKTILVSNRRPSNLTENIEFNKIKTLTFRQIGEFSLKGSCKYCDTDFQLSIHTDGFVINPHLWNDQFFEYDYIGAPWPIIFWAPVNRVGNIGFCLRSKKFLQLSSHLEYNPNIHDDIYLTNTFRWYFEKNGCKYAPVQVAMKFSLQSLIPQCQFDLTKSFGFHGKQFPQCLEKINQMHQWWDNTYQKNNINNNL